MGRRESCGGRTDYSKGGSIGFGESGGGGRGMEFRGLEERGEEEVGSWVKVIFWVVQGKEV